jgi:hypothetical protein
MNDRIKLLAKKAGGHPNYSAFKGHFLPPPPDYIDPATVDLEKFAELIVRECMRMCEVAEMSFVTHDCDVEASGAITVKQFIAEHFGVGEE